MLVLTLAVLSISGAHGARLLDDAPLLAQADAPPPMVGLPTDAQVSSRQLQADIDGLRALRPGIGGPIALTITGGSLVLFGAMYAIIGAAAVTGLGVLNPFLVIGIVALAIGVPLTLLGSWMLWTRISDRRRIDDEVGKLRLELNRARAREGTPAPNRQMPLPPVTPPPQVLDVPPPSMLVATF